jgi:hypothetical protein
MWQRPIWLGVWACVWAAVLSCSGSSGDQVVGSPGGSARGAQTGGSGGAAGSGQGGRGPSGGAGGFVLSLGQGGGGGTTAADDDCADSAKVIYLVTQENYLYSFDPRIGGTAAYQRIGTLNCETESTPQSMSVDRAGRAYVFYSSGHLYYVSTTTAQCTPTSYQHPVSPAKSFNQLGMGFTAKSPSSSEQVLYINSPDFGLATVDLQTLVVTKLNVLQATVAELTGGPDALLFMFTSDASQLSQVARSTYQPQPLHRFNLQGVSAFAFARYAGVFYVFTAGGSSSRTSTTTFDPQTNTELVRDPDIGVTVVGAGQSTCVPPPTIY